MNDIIRNLIIEEISETIDIPDYAYEKAEARYKDLGEWFSRGEAICSLFDPHIYPQGSFRLGTVIRPIDDDGEYDLDMGCRLKSGITKKTHTQEQLKAIVGHDLEDYRIARGIKEKKEEKHRCWRLQYADKLKFHLDAVPTIPETSERIQLIKNAIYQTGTPEELSSLVANLTGAITDNRMRNYSIIDDTWHLSNSEGFALWFESRMRLATVLMENLAKNAKAEKVDELPAYRWKSPLQKSVQLLKRHRDIFFTDDEDSKPASVIITTLSALAYQGEQEVIDALETILYSMESFVNSTTPRVANPTNPIEDFADRWSDPAAAHLDLEAKFWQWLQEAQKDFKRIWNERKPELIIEMTKNKLGASLNIDKLKSKVGVDETGSLLTAAVAPSGLSFPDKPIVPKKPAKFAGRIST